MTPPMTPTMSPSMTPPMTSDCISNNGQLKQRCASATPQYDKPNFQPHKSSVSGNTLSCCVRKKGFYKRHFTRVPSASKESLQITLEETKFIKKLHDMDPVLVITYGSQSGTACEFAYRLMMSAKHKGWNSIVINPSTVRNMHEYVKLASVPGHVAVFILATYGDGGATYNAENFYQFLKEARSTTDFTRLQYSVFGLGNDGYQYYNFFGKYVNSRLKELGGTCIFPLGLGNAAANIEVDFNEWKAAFIEAIIIKRGNKKADGPLQLQFKLEHLIDVPGSEFYQGEPSENASYLLQKSPYNMYNPFLARITSITDLHSTHSERTWLRIEMDITGSRMMWKCGDQIGLYPETNYDDVLTIANLLNIDLHQKINFENKDPEEVMYKHRFPCPCTYMTALFCYLDINRPPTTDLLTELANHAKDAHESESLRMLGSPEGGQVYSSWLIRGHKNLRCILEDFPSCRPPVEVLLEMLPRLQPRYYSISSSPKVNKAKIAITVVLVQHLTPDEPLPDEGYKRFKRKRKRVFRGVASTHMARIKNLLHDVELSRIPMFCREGRIKLPFSTETPMVMIGAGTGIAPFIGFIEQRNFEKEKGEEIGEMVLYFGCRSVHEDFIYKDFLERIQEKKVLTELQIAFSRDQQEKQYVQHLVKKNKYSFWRYVEKQGAHVYIGGDGRRMAPDVRQAITDIAMELGSYTIDGKDYLEKLKLEGRFQQDVWTSLYEHAM